MTNPALDTNFLKAALAWAESVNKGGLFTNACLQFVGSGVRCHGNHTYLGFKRISQKELDAICAAVNIYFKMSDSDFRVINRGGEIMPVRDTP